MESVNALPEMSEKFDIVLKQLMKAKSEMGSRVKKDSSNPFHKSKYASLGAHLELCENVLLNHGLLFMHTTNFINGSPVLIATIHHPESCQWTKSYLPLPNPKNDSQGVGASITYMRRYSINSMLGLNAEDDDGETSSGRGQYAKKEAAEAAAKQKNQNDTTQKNYQKINSQQVSQIKFLENKMSAKSKNKLYLRLLETFKIQKIEDLNVTNFPSVLAAFEYSAAQDAKEMQNSSKVQQLEAAHA